MRRSLLDIRIDMRNIRAGYIKRISTGLTSREVKTLAFRQRVDKELSKDPIYSSLVRQSNVIKRDMDLQRQIDVIASF